MNKCNFVPYGDSENRCKKCGYITWVDKSKSFDEIMLVMIDNGYPKPECMLINESLTMNQRLENAGIETIYPLDFKFSRHEKRGGEIKIKYKGKEILRPNAHSCVLVVKREFNINI